MPNVWPRDAILKMHMMLEVTGATLTLAISTGVKIVTGLYSVVLAVC